MFQQPALADLRLHRGLEEAIGAAAIGFGSIESGIRVVQQLGPVGGVGREGSDTDARSERHGAWSTYVLALHRGKNVLCKPPRLRGVAEVRGNNGKLVAAEAGHHLALL